MIFFVVKMQKELMFISIQKKLCDAPYSVGDILRSAQIALVIYSITRTEREREKKKKKKKKKKKNLKDHLCTWNIFRLTSVTASFSTL